MSVAAPPSSGTDSDQAHRERMVSLLQGCAEGREQSLAELYAACSSQLFGVLMRILKIESLAEDALQETFVKIWNKADQYSPELSAPVTWMTSIARNQALDALRRRKVREDNEAPNLVALIDATPSAGKSVSDMNEDAQQLMQCLEHLQPRARDCIVKAYCEGYSHDELSETHGTPLGTVKSWIRRGLLSLRECLNELALNDA